MKRPEPFELFRPTSVEEASRLLRQNGGSYCLAGGTDLAIAIKEKGLTPQYVVDLKRIPSLSGIEEHSDGSITVGALTTMREAETSPLLRRRYPFLAQSAAEVGSIQIRNRATVGGNVANATPSADLAPSLLVLNAQVKISSAGSDRLIPLEQFFVGPGKTVLQPGEIVTQIRIPPVPAGFRGEYIKFSPREMMDLAYIGVAVGITVQGGRCAEARIALGAVSPTPIRARKAETILQDVILTEELAERAAREASDECNPISDVRSSAAYRREMVRVNTKRALLNAFAGRPQESWLERRDRRY